MYDIRARNQTRQACPLPEKLFHPDCYRRHRILTGSADPRARRSRACGAAHTTTPITAGGDLHPALSCPLFSMASIAGQDGRYRAFPVPSPDRRDYGRDAPGCVEACCRRMTGRSASLSPA